MYALTVSMVNLSKMYFVQFIFAQTLHDDHVLECLVWRVRNRKCNDEAINVLKGEMVVLA